MLDRRTFAKYALPCSVGAAFAVATAATVARAHDAPLRPPGFQNERDFMARCIKCGRCVEACPYAVVHVAGFAQGAAAGTPKIDPRERACRLCEEFPCVNACPTGALRGVEVRKDVTMGVAKIDEDVCIAFDGMRCEVCYRACPLIDEAICIDYRMLEGDAIHSVFAPVVDEDVCVGCGLCVERCIVSDPEVAIKIVPTET